MPKSVQRVVIEPAEVSVVSSRRADISPAYVSFGKNAWGNVVLLMSFQTPFSDTTQIIGAHLVMDPPPRSIAGPSAVSIKIARVLEPWSPHDVSWSTLPQLSSNSAAIWASSWGNRSLRIDVTEQVQRWREHRRDDHGLAVLASPQNEIGETYSLGTGDGRGPRLDVYLR